MLQATVSNERERKEREDKREREERENVCHRARQGESRGWEGHWDIGGRKYALVQDVVHCVNETHSNQ